MEYQQIAEPSGSLQAICADQQHAIRRLLADFQTPLLGSGGVFLDFVRSGMSGRATMASEDGGSAERRVRELEDLLTNTQRLLALSQTVNMLLHELSQPLTAIGIYAAACRHLVLLGRQQELDGVLRHINEQGERTFQIIERIRELTGAPGPVD